MKANLSDIMTYMMGPGGKHFAARVLSGLRLEYTDTVPVAGVTIKNRVYTMMFNPEWLKEAEYNDIYLIIVHEAHHLFLDHIGRILHARAHYEAQGKLAMFSMLSPIAADLATNSMVKRYDHDIFDNAPDLPPVMPGEPPFDFLPIDRTYEWYLAELIKEVESGDLKIEMRIGTCSAGEGSSKGKNQSHTISIPAPSDDMLDAHRQLENDVKDMTTDEQLSLGSEMKSKLAKTMKSAVEAQHAVRGTVPGHLDELIKDMLREPQIPWTTILRNKILNGQKTKRERGISRPKRRYLGIPELIPFPGLTRHQSYYITFCIDTSASMGSDELEMALSELRSLRKADKDIRITVLEADTHVEHEYELEDIHDKINNSMHGRGGTTFDPALQRSKELRPDLAIYFTDGYAPTPHPDVYPRCPMIWVLTPHGKCPDTNHGMVIQTVRKS